MVAVSFIGGSFCLMNGKEWEILKISQSTCRLKWRVLMSSHKAWVVQGADWPKGVRSGFNPHVLLRRLSEPSFLHENATCHAHITQWTLLFCSRLFGCPPQSFQPLYCNQPLGGRILAPAPRPCHTWSGGARGMGNVNEREKAFQKLWIIPKDSVRGHLRGYFINQLSLPNT